jgi:hypothetical protein
VAVAGSIDSSARANAAVTLLLRRPLLVAFVLGCAVSVLASGRFTLRLIVDGTLSMAFVPASQMLGLAAVYPFRRTKVSFAEAVDRFFAGNTIWLAWMFAFMVLAVVLPVTGQGQLQGPFLISSTLPILWSVVVDRRFFADGMGRTGWSGALDIAIERLVAWLAAMLYFLGVAVDGRFGEMFYLFVEIWESIVRWAAS